MSLYIYGASHEWRRQTLIIEQDVVSYGPKVFASVYSSPLGIARNYKLYSVIDLLCTIKLCLGTWKLRRGSNGTVSLSFPK